MSNDQIRAGELISASLTGHPLSAIDVWEHGWAFRFSNGASVTTQTLWRLSVGESIAVTSEDHSQKFGLPEPVDAGERVTSLLFDAAGGATVQAVTADLRITFGHLTTLEFLNTSSGYEAWEFNSGSDGEQGCKIIALRGGGLAIFAKA